MQWLFSCVTIKLKLWFSSYGTNNALYAGRARPDQRSALLPSVENTKGENVN